MIGCVVLAIGGALQASSYSIPQLIIGRIIAGLGNGLNTSTIPVWHSELSRPESRGRGVSREDQRTQAYVLTTCLVDLYRACDQHIRRHVCLLDRLWDVFRPE